MIAITMDLDWASPAEVNTSLEMLTSMGVDKVTTFVPPYADKKEEEIVMGVLLRWFGRAGAKNVGIHPVPYREGFLGENIHHSTLKKTVDDAIEVVPSADFYRCHGLYDSHWLQKEMKDRGFKFCSNRCEWREYHPKPRKNAVGMWDIPIWWEDSIEFRGWNTIYETETDDIKPSIFSMNARDTSEPSSVVVINLHPHYMAQWTPWMAELMKRRPALTWLRETVPNE